jgi:hypothetical protein
MGRATKSFANAKENADASVPEGTANRILLSLIAASTLVFTWLACRQFHGFSTETNEITYYSYALFHTSSERFLPLYFMEGNLLGAHPNIFMVLLLPIYKLVPTVELLFLAQSLLLSVSAWPLYLLLKRQVDDTVTALLFTAAYLMFPPVVSQHLNQIHDDQFANVWLLLAAVWLVLGAASTDLFDQGILWIDGGDVWSLGVAGPSFVVLGDCPAAAWVRILPSCVEGANALGGWDLEHTVRNA